MGAFMVVVLKQPVEIVWEAFAPYHAQFKPFRDASYGDTCTYECTVYHCLKGLEFAINLGWYKFKEFDNKEYEYYEKVENGDLNWIIPNKFIAFMGPVDNPPGQPKRGNGPEDYIQVFKHFGVTHVIRLNEPKYDRLKFTRNGINHTDLFFIDGSTPADSIVQQFLRVAEAERGAIAIHCKAGLGRTGTLIGIYAMKHFKFPAAYFIGWIRIARPGSILGPQQHYLIKQERTYLDASAISRGVRMVEMSPDEKRKRKFGD
jgi:cell division cycle 14